MSCKRVEIYIEYHQSYQLLRTLAKHERLAFVGGARAGGALFVFRSFGSLFLGPLQLLQEGLTGQQVLLEAGHLHQLILDVAQQQARHNLGNQLCKGKASKF